MKEYFAKGPIHTWSTQQEQVSQVGRYPTTPVDVTSSKGYPKAY